MKPSRALLSDFVCRALAVAGIALVMSSWGFVPHRHLHAKAWSSLPHELRKALGNDPTPLVARATDADSRKHTDSLEATRHYFDLDDTVGEGLDLWGLPWSGAKQLLEGQTPRQPFAASASCRGNWNGATGDWSRRGHLRTVLSLTWKRLCGQQPTWAITSETRMFHCTPQATTTANAPASVASMPCGKPTLWSGSLQGPTSKPAPLETWPSRITTPSGRHGKSSSKAMRWCPRCWRQNAHGRRCATGTAMGFADADEPCNSLQPRSLSPCGTASPMDTPGHGIAWPLSALPPLGTAPGWMPARPERRGVQEGHGKNSLHCTFLNGGPIGSLAFHPNHDKDIDHLDLRSLSHGVPCGVVSWHRTCV